MKNSFISMLSLEQIRKIDPGLKDVSDQDLETIVADLYCLGQLAFDVWKEEKAVPNVPFGYSHFPKK